jgi:hypothetical protein
VTSSERPVPPDVMHGPHLDLVLVTIEQLLVLESRELRMSHRSTRRGRRFRVIKSSLGNDWFETSPTPEFRQPRRSKLVTAMA